MSPGSVWRTSSHWQDITTGTSIWCSVTAPAQRASDVSQGTPAVGYGESSAPQPMSPTPGRKSNASIGSSWRIARARDTAIESPKMPTRGGAGVVACVVVVSRSIVGPLAPAVVVGRRSSGSLAGADARSGPSSMSVAAASSSSTSAGAASVRSSRNSSARVRWAGRTRVVTMTTATTVAAAIVGGAPPSAGAPAVRRCGR